MLAGAAGAQDAHFTQVSSGPVLFNPAFAGNAGCTRASANLSVGPIERSSFCIAYDQYVHPIRSGFGFNYIYYNDGNLYKKQNADIFYSFNFKINDNSNIRAAVNAGMGSRYFNVNPPPDWICCFPYIPPVITSNPKYYFNIGGGIIYNYKNFIAGVSLDHLNNPDISVFENKQILPGRFNAHTSYQHDFRKDFSITPFFMFTKQQDFENMLYSVLFKISFLKCGAGFRQGFNNPDAAFGMLGYQGKVLSIGYSYELIISRLSNATGGAHEINAAFKFNCKNKTDKFNIAKINGF